MRYLEFLAAFAAVLWLVLLGAAGCISEAERLAMDCEDEDGHCWPSMDETTTKEC